MITTGVTGRMWRASIAPSGDVLPWEGRPLRWFVAAEDRRFPWKVAGVFLTLAISAELLADGGGAGVTLLGTPLGILYTCSHVGLAFRDCR